MSSPSDVLSSFSSVVITGGSSGIGKSFIELCGNLNPDLTVCNLSRRAPDIKNKKLKLRHFPCDLAQPEEICRTAAEVEKFLTLHQPSGRVLLVNNSGFGCYGSFPEPGLTQTLSMIDVNVRSVAHLTGLLLPLLKVRGGVIVNQASTAAFMPVASMAAYAATKAFVLHWSLALNEELRGSRVRTLAFCPGTTRTAFFDQAGVKPAVLAGRLAQTSGEVAAAMLHAIGSGRAQSVSGLVNKIMVGSASKLPKPAAARVAGIVMRRFGQKQPRE